MSGELPGLEIWKPEKLRQNQYQQLFCTIFKSFQFFNSGWKFGMSEAPTISSSQQQDSWLAPENCLPNFNVLASVFANVQKTNEKSVLHLIFISFLWLFGFIGSLKQSTSRDFLINLKFESSGKNLWACCFQLVVLGRRTVWNSRKATEKWTLHRFPPSSHPMRKINFATCF